MLVLDLADAEEADRITVDPTRGGLVRLSTRFRGKEAEVLLTNMESEKLAELLWMSTLTARELEAARG